MPVTRGRGLSGDNPPLTVFEEEARSLNWLVARLKQTEAALALICEDLREERRRARQATRFLREYRRLYRIACLRAAAPPDSFQQGGFRAGEGSPCAADRTKSGSVRDKGGRVIPWVPLKERRSRRFNR